MNGVGSELLYKRNAYEDMCSGIRPRVMVDNGPTWSAHIEVVDDGQRPPTPSLAASLQQEAPVARILVELRSSPGSSVVVERAQVRSMVRCCID